MYEPAPVPATVERYVLAVSEAPPPQNGHPILAGRHLAVVDDGRGVATRLAALLEADGASVRLVAAGEGLVDGHGPVDGLVHLGALAALPEPDPVVALRALFEQVREAALGGASLLLVATALGGRFGQDAAAGGALKVGGAAGLIKTVAVEWPGIKARVVDLDPRADAARLAARLRAELLASDDLIEVGYADGVRSTRAVVAAPPAPAAAAGAVARRLVGRALTGGARGITARVAIALARRYRCRIELVGRSPLPPPADDPAVAGAADLPALRRALLAQGVLREPAAIEARVRPHPRRPRDPRHPRRDPRRRQRGRLPRGRRPHRRRSARLLDQLHARHGRLDGVVHGAGVLDDKLLRHKTGDAFERVVATKLTGALTLAERLRADTRFVVFFASIAGRVRQPRPGRLRRRQRRPRHPGVVAGRRASPAAWSRVDWGPWAGAGMVSPELEREYARRGIGLIDPERGVAALLDELAAGGDAQVVLMAGDPRALAGQAAGPPRAPRRAADAAAALAIDG